MNYIALIALILGMISIIITIKYIENYEILNRKLDIITNRSNTKIPNEFISIQDELDVNQTIFLDIVKKNKTSIIDILKKSIPTKVSSESEIKESFSNLDESFVNFGLYLNNNQRKIAKNKSDKIIIPSNLNEEQKHITYDDRLKDAYNSINRQSEPTLNNNFEYKNILKENEFYKKNKCISNYDSKEYIYYVNEPEFCKGILTYDL